MTTDPTTSIFQICTNLVPYEPYGDYQIFPNGQEALVPAAGSVPRGWKPYEYENTAEGYQLAKTELKNPLPYTEDNLAAGRQLYTIYCAVCHGDQGDGQGILVQREKILGIPRYDDAGRDITEGSVYHVMYYGLNAMGSYASQTSIDERWLIDHYVMTLKNDLLGGEERAFDQESQDSIPQGPTENLIPAVNAEEDQVSEQQETTGAYEEAQENEN
ncbi:cytochrome c [Antarcticibacterium sp. 1MA-6-2]|uniref:c-type cytochrome n=1 Tax=Antarcticibacterium sp. 1MA-6-2 TaxID=2908210 RepID=UPI00288325FD|nr:cytochrome c [Antarcticibacterium sp. 1MA-6-2]